MTGTRIWNHKHARTDANAAGTAIRHVFVLPRLRSRPLKFSGAFLGLLCLGSIRVARIHLMLVSRIVTFPNLCLVLAQRQALAPAGSHVGAAPRVCGGAPSTFLPAAGDRGVKQNLFQMLFKHYAQLVREYCRNTVQILCKWIDEWQSWPWHSPHTEAQGQARSPRRGLIELAFKTSEVHK